MYFFVTNTLFSFECNSFFFNSFQFIFFCCFFCCVLRKFFNNFLMTPICCPMLLVVCVLFCFLFSSTFCFIKGGPGGQLLIVIMWVWVWVCCWLIWDAIVIVISQQKEKTRANDPGSHWMELLTDNSLNFLKHYPLIPKEIA